MYELIILSLLMRMPFHGYRISHVINDIIGPYAKLSNGRLYPLLKKLKQEGYVSMSIQRSKKRKSQIYEITKAGKNRFHTIMMDVNSNPISYKDIFFFKVSVFEFLSPEERKFLITHYINFCSVHIKHLYNEKKDVDTWRMENRGISEILSVIDHKIQQWKLESEWVNKLSKKE